MSLRITIDIFSGRENPVVELAGKEAQEAIKRLQPCEGLKKEKKGFRWNQPWDIVD